MLRVRDLDFRYPAALYRGDGSGITVVVRSRPFAEGSSWARVVESVNAGWAGRYLFLERRAGGWVDGRLVVEDRVFLVSGDARFTAPLRSDLDPRLTACGEFGEVEDLEFARRADVESGIELRASYERVAANSFTVTATLDGRRWSVRVGPTRRDNTTPLSCRAANGGTRRLETAAERDVLERARRQAVTIEATYSQRRRWRGGMRERTVVVTLGPDPGTS